MSKVGSVLASVRNYLFGHPSEDIIQKKEQLFQTYLIVFSLLLVYDRVPELQRYVMQAFLLYTLIALIYYILLTRFYKVVNRFVFNILALPMGLLFSLAFFACVGYMIVDYGETPVVLGIRFYL